MELCVSSKKKPTKILLKYSKKVSNEQNVNNNNS